MKRLFPSGLALLSGVLLIAWSGASFAYQPSPANCAAEADRASRDVGTGLGGIGRGAAGGALFGAIVGNKKGAKRGAALGGVIGGVRRGSQKNDVYENVYDSCMRRR